MQRNYINSGWCLLLFLAVKSIIIYSQPRENLKQSMVNAHINNKGELVISPSSTSASSDFDFLVGNHAVHHKKLKNRLTSSSEWIEFEGSHKQELILEGKGNLEQHKMIAADGKPVEGMALRLFNPQTKLWSIYWADSRSAALDVPMVGSFENRIGHFYAKDSADNKPIIVYFLWDAADPEKPVWSQAFSTDNGKTWEWNWYMHFRKL